MLKKLFKTIWKTYRIFRSTLLNLMFIVLVIGVISALLYQPLPQVPNQTALHLAPEGVLVEHATYQPSTRDLLLDTAKMPKEALLRDFIEAIQRAAIDDRISGIVLQLDYFAGGGLSKMKELGQALDAFRESGKPIIAVSGNYTQQQYYLASYADEILIDELGKVLLTGFGIYRNYYREAAEKLALDVNIFRVGAFKDAVEPYFLDGMSEESKRHNQAWVDELWQQFADDIQTRRTLNGSLDDYIHHLGHLRVDPVQANFQMSSSAERAKQAGLVDAILTRPAIRQKLTAQFGWNEQRQSFRSIRMSDYLAALRLTQPAEGKHIGLLVGSGVIVDGLHDKSRIGGDSFARLIRQAGKDKSLHALVIRIDSGGGSATASELIRQEILNLRASGMPVYVSMGSVAASGGYWIASAADEIWASPQTITGSIGVFGVVPTFNRSFGKLGINNDGFGTTDIADLYHLERPMSEQAKNLVQHSVNEIYAHFIELVAEARSLPKANVHFLAQGRVWTGKKALELGLVDQLGSLDEVLDAVAEQQGLDQYQVKRIEAPLSVQEQIMRALMEQAHAVSKATIGQNTASYVSSWLTQLGKDTDTLFQVLEAGGEKALNFQALCLDCEIF